MKVKSFFIFLFFLTLHADLLAITLGDFTIRINNLIGLSLLIFFLIHHKMTFFTVEKKLLTPILFLIFSILISCFLSDYFLRCSVFCGWFFFTLLCYFFLPFLLLKIHDEKKILKLYFASFICVGIYACLQGIVSFFGIQNLGAHQTFMGHLVRPNAFCYEPSYYALYMTPVVMLVNGYYLLKKECPFFIFNSLKLRHILFVNFLYVISMTASAFFSYIIFMLVLLVIYLLPSIRKQYPLLGKNLFRFGMCFSLVFLFLGFTFKKFAALFFMKFFVNDFEQHHSFSERWEGIMTSLSIFKEHPFFGVGLGAYPSYFYDNWLCNKISSFERIDLINHSNPIKLFEPTNVVTEILASTGIIGTAAFLFLLYVYFQKGKEAFINEKRVFRKDMSLALVISSVITLIVLQFNQGIFRTYIWTHLGLSIAYFQNYKINI